MVPQKQKNDCGEKAQYTKLIVLFEGCDENSPVRIYNFWEVFVWNVIFHACFMIKDKNKLVEMGGDNRNFIDGANKINVFKIYYEN